jgi:hypothetical protein
MKFFKSLFAVGAALAFTLVFSPRAGVSAETKTETKAVEIKTDATADVVTVKGKDFGFTVHQPDGWQGDTEAAKKYHGNVLFTPKAGADQGTGTMILVSADHKFDENVALRLQSTIDSYRQKYPQMVVGEVDVKHPLYPTYVKALSQPGVFYQYVAYLNPGSLQPYTVFVAMSKKKNAPTPAETAAFKDVLASLRMAPPTVKPE